MAKNVTVSNVCDIISMVSAWKDQSMAHECANVVGFFCIFVKILLTCYVITVKYTTYIVSKTFVLLFFFANSSVTDFIWITANSILSHLNY